MKDIPRLFGSKKATAALVLVLVNMLVGWGIIPAESSANINNGLLLYLGGQSLVDVSSRFRSKK